MATRRTKIEPEIFDKITVVGYTPHKGQQKLIDLVLDPQYKFYTFSIGRQWGKSVFAQNMMLYWAINEKDSKIYYVSPFFKLARIMFKEMLDAIGDSGLLKKINKTSLEFEFTNGSTITYHSGENEAALRGASLTHLIIDEMAHTKPSLWKVVLNATLFVKGRKAVFISTPNGRNHFYELYLRGESTKAIDKRYCCYTAPSTDSPYVPDEELAEASHNELFYRQEYLAEFLEDGLTVFKGVKDCIYSGEMSANVPSKDEKYYIGVDLANVTDFTVAICMDENKRVVDMLRIHEQAEWKDIVDCLAEFYFKWKPVHGYVEVNFNPSVYEDLKRAGCKNFERWTTSYNKAEIISDLIYEFGNKTISIPNNKEMKNELDVYTYAINRKTGRLQFSAPNGFHDDIVMSLAFTLQSWKAKKGKKGKFCWSVGY